MLETRIDDQQLTRIISHWDIDFIRVFDDIAISGSPERMISRLVFEDRSGSRSVLEEIPQRLVKHKELINTVLVRFEQAGLKHVQPYCRLSDGATVLEAEGRYWQVVPYLESVELKRPDYAFEGWRGEQLAAFLIAMRRISEQQSLPENLPKINLPGFVESFKMKLAQHDPQILERIQDPLSILADRFFPAWPDLPRAFCHGDIHPLNVIWGPNGMRAVIDWEFLGEKFETYDAANYLGCIGMEAPAALLEDQAGTFVGCLLSAGLFSRSSLDLLPEAVLAVRLAWLSEWLRKHDQEMVEMEIDYINLLADNLTRLRLRWKL